MILKGKSAKVFIKNMELANAKRATVDFSKEIKEMEKICDKYNEDRRVNIVTPEWWFVYKIANPKDKDEYNPRKHCCPRFWKDFCNCMQ